jgi:hypothetical protein
LGGYRKRKKDKNKRHRKINNKKTVLAVKQQSTERKMPNGKI